MGAEIWVVLILGIGWLAEALWPRTETGDYQTLKEWGEARDALDHITGDDR